MPKGKFKTERQRAGASCGRGSRVQRKLGRMARGHASRIGLAVEHRLSDGGSKRVLSWGNPNGEAR